VKGGRSEHLAFPKVVAEGRDGDFVKPRVAAAADGVELG
jgi:hypothetical protein